MGTGGGAVVPEAVERYLTDLLPDPGEVLAAMEAHGLERGFPFIGPLVGRLLRLLAASVGARRVFECGSGYGYSAAWFCGALPPDGELFLTDGSAKNLSKAREYLGRLGYLDRCRFLEGEAVALLKETPGPFDVILVDIEKEGYPDSLEVTVPKLRSGGLLVTDNLLWDGEVVEEKPKCAAGRAIKRYNELLYAHPELETTILPLRDGVGVSRKR